MRSSINSGGHWQRVGDWLNEERFNGASIIVGVQYLGQIIARYGKDWSDGFLASCATKIWFNPGEDNTAQYLSKSLGEQELAISNRSNTVNYGKNSGDSRSTNDQLHKKPLIEAHAIRQLPQGACIIESPGVGDKQVAGVPFQHHFSYSDTEATAFRSKSAKEFAQIRALMVESQQSLLATDHSQKLTEHNAILDRLLPLPESPERPNALGQDLSKHFTELGYDLSQYQIEPAKKYYVPPELLDGSTVKIEIQDLPRLIEHMEFNVRWRVWQDILVMFADKVGEQVARELESWMYFHFFSDKFERAIHEWWIVLTQSDTIPVCLNEIEDLIDDI